MRDPVLRLHTDELVVDNFAGGGGASMGIQWALGRSPDIAVNHDPEALAMHAANHPETKHFREDVFDIDPVKVCNGKPVALAWFSPDCTYFSKSRGGKPFRDRDRALRRRGLAWVVIKWAKAVRPRVIILENVEEFAEWGPLGPDGRPDPDQRGFTFRRWKSQFENAGYELEMRELKACDYGAPTSRKRLFIIARSDGMPIVWPEPTHGPGRALPYRVAGECIDWSIPCPSIFGRKKQLAEKTLARIARGVWKFVINTGSPFIIPLTHGGDLRVHPLDEPMRTITSAHRGEQALIAPTLIQTSWGERPGQAPRVPGLDKPLGTIMAGGGKHALVAAFMQKYYGERRPGETRGSSLGDPLHTMTTENRFSVVTSHMLKLKGTCRDGQSMLEPCPTICATGTHIAEVRTFLTKFYGQGTGSSLTDPSPTITTKDRMGLVTVMIEGQTYAIVDIGMRMLAPHELFRAQGFGPDYKIAIKYNGKAMTKTAQTRMCGNSVCPPVATALVKAQFAAEALKEQAA